MVDKHGVEVIFGLEIIGSEPQLNETTALLKLKFPSKKLPALPK